MSDLASVRAIVYGRVQGVFFRAFASGLAKELGVTGYVRNLATGSAVEIVAEGEIKKLEALIGDLEVGPPGAIVKNVATKWSEYTGSYAGFNVRY